MMNILLMFAATVGLGPIALFYLQQVGRISDLKGEDLENTIGIIGGLAVSWWIFLAIVSR